MPARFAILALLTGCLDLDPLAEDERTELCGGQEGSPDGPSLCDPDADGDGVSAAQDCDDGDPRVWADEEYEGHLQNQDVSGFCDGYCRRNVTGSVILTHTDLSDLRDLRCVESVGGGSLTIRDADALTSLAGLERLASFEGELQIEDNDGLLSLDGLEGLAAVSALTVRNNRALVSIEGLSSLSWVELVLIEDSPELASLAGLEGLAAVEGTLVLRGLDALTDVDGLANLRSVAWPLELIDNASLADLGGLSSLETAGGLTISENPALTDLAGLEGLSVIDRTLLIQSNAALADVSALHGVSSVAWDLTIQDNPALPAAEAEALRDAIGSVGGAITVQDNGP